MARSALWAPAHRVLQRSALGQAYPGNAPAAAPSIDFLGSGLQDHRLPYNSLTNAAGALGWYGSNNVCVVDQVPSAIANNNIAAAANVTSGTAMTLVTTSGAGITVLGVGGQLWYPFLNTIPAGACVIDATQALVTFGGSNNLTGFYDPTKSIARAVSITGVAASVGGAFTVSGYDVYGQAMTQTLTHAGGATTVTSTKAFKAVTSVVPAFTDAHNYSVGTGDVFGINIASDFFAYVKIVWDNVLQLVATYTAAVTTTPSATTGDVRGTFTAGSASDGTRRLQVFVMPSLARAKANTLWGLTQA